MSVETETNQPVDETLEEARARFYMNYLLLGGSDNNWFDQHVPSLLNIAVPERRKTRQEHAMEMISSMYGSKIMAAASI